ncbi:MAG: DUF167 family protein [Thermodesulfobacteriota bacterium]
MPSKTDPKPEKPDSDLYIRQTRDGLNFQIHVLPKSSRTMIAGLHGTALKIKITAPPVEGAANQMCIEVLSKSLKIPKSSLAIISGQNARIKQIRFTAVTSNTSENEINRVAKLLKTFAAAS